MSRLIPVAIAGLFIGAVVSLSPAQGKGERPVHTEKLTAPIKVQLQLDGPAPEKPGDEFRLVGILKSTRDMDRVDLNWKLGPKTEIVSGRTRETVQLKANEEFRVEVILRAKSPGAQKVRLTVKGGSQEASFAASATYRGERSKKRDEPKDRDGKEKRPRVFR